MRRRPPALKVRLTPIEAFVVAVTWSTLGIIGIIVTVLLLPWSLPFAFAGVALGGYFTARFISGRIESG